MVLCFYILSGYRMFYNALIAMIGASAFTSTFPPIQFWRLLYWLPCRCSPACFVPFTPDGSEFAFTHYWIRFVVPISHTNKEKQFIVSCSCFAYTTTFISLLSSLTTNWGSNWCIFLKKNVRVSWRLNKNVSINKWAPTLLFVTYKYCLSTIILKEATHMCQFF